MWNSTLPYAYNLSFICRMELSRHNHLLWCTLVHEGFVSIFDKSESMCQPKLLPEP